MTAGQLTAITTKQFRFFLANHGSAAISDTLLDVHLVRKVAGLSAYRLLYLLYF